MLDKYLKTEATLLPITFIDEKYFVDVRGEVYSLENDTYIPIKVEGNWLSVTIAGIPYIAPKTNLIQLVWKPVFPDDLLFYLLEVDVLHTDGNTTNNHPINLIWKFKDNRFGDKFRIPGFSRYLFDDNLNIYDRIRGVNLNVTYENGRYVSCNVYPDYLNGQRTVWYVIHRMVAYSFVDYSCNVCRLDVNHIDGNKWNFQIDNLEFTTRKGNNIHALVSGLKTDSNIISVFDIETGESKEYISQAACAKELNIDNKLLSWRLTREEGKVWDGRYQYTIIRQRVNRQKYATEPKQVLIRNKNSGEVVELNSLKKASEFLNIGYAALKKRVSRNSTLFGEWELKAFNPKIGEQKPTF